MKLVLKQDIVIPAGTIMDSEGVPRKTERDPSAFVSHLIPFGKNATGELMVGIEPGDSEFDQWFGLTPWPWEKK